MNLLAPLIVPASNPELIIPDLQAAISGTCTLLPLPEKDRGTASLLRQSMKIGTPISEAIALVLPTSGSTGTPKGAQLTPLNLVASADATHTVLGGAGAWLLAMPAHYIAGIQVLVRSLVAGLPPVTMDVSSGFNVAAFADAADLLARLYPAERRYCSLTPMQLAKCLETLAGIEACRSFTTLLIGGGPTHPQLAESCRKLQISITTTYGSSETAGGCVYDGTPLPGVEVEIISGRVVIGGDVVAAGYRNAPNDPFQGGKFFTNDAGVFYEGKLTITGRIDNLIDSGGLKLSPELLETQIQSCPGVDTAVVVGVPDPRLGQAICAAFSGTTNPAAILEFLADADVPRWQLPKQLRRVDQLPLTHSGKIDRQAVLQLFNSRPAAF